MNLSPYVHILGRGPGRSRGLTSTEAREAMRIMLSGGADPEAVGAILMLLRMKGETADEIAGFATTVQASLGPLPPVDLDWPSYAAGRSRGLPWFLMSAKLVALSGHRVLMHGWNGADPAVRAGLTIAGIPVAKSIGAAAKDLDRGAITYLPLEILSPPLLALLRLRDVLGLRSCINTVARMLNPAGAPASVQGVFHPAYRSLQADAARLLRWSSLTVIKGGGGEFERNPAKPATCLGLRAGTPWQAVSPASFTWARPSGDEPKDPARLRRLWQGTSEDPFSEQVVLRTAELALDTLGVTEPRALAQDLWSGRTRSRAA
ncbi:glycosyl transferase family protein [Aestuariivita sp.]|uniref:glycosyl transferase family protein n=1 Tax=Aestuariivita sp. TaxID=1872407 RepID=UPI00216E62A0|nr:glycosyl transferase family protein [Aestuariivita sp.]MCE8008184.1 glycosyl transferase family protein [Aestuariivita sp.]